MENHTSSLPLVHDLSAPTTNRSVTDLDPLVQPCVEACRRAKRYRIASTEAAELHLRAIREAGRLLSLVDRARGGRPPANSSRGLTSYQLAIQEAGISRQTASTWRDVAEVPEAEFERFLAQARRGHSRLTIAELLRHPCEPSTAPRTVTLTFSAAERERFTRLIDVLGAAHFSATPAETVLLIVERAHAAWLDAQKSARPS